MRDARDEANADMEPLQPVRDWVEREVMLGRLSREDRTRLEELIAHLEAL